jgi:Metallo-peptidase family M12B Reprolysin-like
MKRILFLMLLLVLAFTSMAQANAVPIKKATDVVVTLDARTGQRVEYEYIGSHWRRSSGYQTVVRVLWRGPDARWLAQTKRAVSLWNRSSRIYMLMATSCPTGRNCVRVYTENLGRNGILGIAYLSGSGGHLYGSGNKVVFNSSYASYGDLNLACHELGHSIGLAHPADGREGPCSHATGSAPRPADYDTLLKVYRHTDSTGPPGAAR